MKLHEQTQAMLYRQANVNHYPSNIAVCEGPILRLLRTTVQAQHTFGSLGKFGKQTGWLPFNCTLLQWLRLGMRNRDVSVDKLPCDILRLTVALKRRSNFVQSISSLQMQHKLCA